MGILGSVYSGCADLVADCVKKWMDMIYRGAVSGETVPLCCLVGPRRRALEVQHPKHHSRFGAVLGSRY